MAGVADDGVKNVLQVATKLVFAPLQRLQFGEAVARGGMSPVAGERHFAARQTAVASQRLLRRFLALAVAVGDFVGEIGERVVNFARLIQPAAHHGVIGLAQPLCRNLLTEQTGGVGVQREQQHAAGGPVETVCRIAFQPGLLMQQLQHGHGGMAVKRAAVYGDARRFVDGDEMRIAVEDGERKHGSTGQGRAFIIRRAVRRPGNASLL